MQHVGVREDEVRAAADLRALLARRVAVVDRGTDLLRQAEGVDRARLVLGERLRRVQVQRARLRIAAQDVERRQVEAQRLARRGAGGDDRRAGPGGEQRLRLVRPQRRDARPGQGVEQRRVKLVRQRLGDRFAGALEGLAHEPLVGPAEVQQGTPGMDFGGDGHALAIVRAP